MILRLILTLSMLAPPSEEAAQAAYSAGDLAGALKMYLELAKAPGAHPPQALDGAHASLRALHRKEPDAGHLCRARNMARELLKRDAFASDQERAAWVEMEAEDTRDLELSRASCPDAPSTEEARADETPPDAAPHVDKPQSEAAPIVGESQSAHEPSEVKPEGPAPLPGTKDSHTPWRPRGRIIAGSTVAAVGVGLLGGLAGVLVGRARADATIASITANAIAEDREYTPAERADVHEANGRYVRLHETAWALGIVGCVSLLTGMAVMLAPTRGASRARLRAGNAGLVYSF